uniref:Uncharacterized protein n=1 Tax=Cacopsylla melanoneura TaxID=428564 RepID=A0A8D8QU80_9HEMI
MLDKLTNDPNAKPNTPNIIMAKFLNIRSLVSSLESQNVINSRIGGNMRANVELDTDPTREITALRLGISRARTKVRVTRAALSMYSPYLTANSLRNLDSSVGNRILIGT